MSEFTINLRSDNPALLVEFNLPPGTHAMIGAALNAEVSIPLAGLAEYAGLIGRTPEGRLYLADPDGENERFIALPAAFPLPPYHFVVFHPAKPAATVVLATAPARRKMPAPLRILAGAAVAGVILSAVAAILLNRPTKPAAVHSPEPQSATPPTAQAAPEKFTPAPPEPAAPPVVETKATVSEPTPAAPKFDLEALAQRIAPAVFRLEVKDAAGKPAGTGTAFAISADGLAVTNFHVVEGGESFIARTTQGAEFTVSGVTATDPAADLALVTIKARNLPFLELGESMALKIGAPVSVFGAPHGLSGTLSEGIISARRSEQEIAGKVMPNGGDLLQITAPISPGSSGSPVIDHSGKVIGVAAAVLSGQAAQNLNFVIPIEAVKKLQKDAASGLADLRRSMPRSEVDQQKSKADPDSKFLSDPDFERIVKLCDSKDWISALKLSKITLNRYPQSALAHFKFANALFGIGLKEQAEVSFKNGLEIDPENSSAWNNLGTVQNALSKNEEARESWNRAVTLNPELSQTWGNLAAYYLKKDDYLNAIPALEALRKLDRVKFENILAVMRKYSGQLPKSQEVLLHFQTMPDGITDSVPANPEKLAASLVAEFLRHGQDSDVQTELADYAATVNPYFDQGKQTKTEILKDLTAYRAQWPLRTLQLVAVESARRDDEEILEATYRLRYTASDGKRNRSGTLVQGIRYTLTNGRWLVSGIQTIERVVE